MWHPDTPSDRTTIPCFPAPFAAAADVEGDVAFATFQGGEDLSGRIAVNRDPLLVLPQTIFTAFATWYHDPTHGVPTRADAAVPERASTALEPALDEGAIGYVGILHDAVGRPTAARAIFDAVGGRSRRCG